MKSPKPIIGKPRDGQPQKSRSTSLSALRAGAGLICATLAKFSTTNGHATRACPVGIGDEPNPAECRCNRPHTSEHSYGVENVPEPTRSCFRCVETFFAFNPLLGVFGVEVGAKSQKIGIVIIFKADHCFRQNGYCNQKSGDCDDGEALCCAPCWHQRPLTMHSGP